MSRIRVLVADDHPAWRRTVRVLLDAPDIEVIGEAEDGARALDAVQALRPDVAILDHEMPHRTGLDVARLVHALDLPTRTILLTVRSSRPLLDRARAHGVSGFVLKDDAATELLASVRAVHAGGCHFSEAPNK